MDKVILIEDFIKNIEEKTFDFNADWYGWFLLFGNPHDFVFEGTTSDCSFLVNVEGKEYKFEISRNSIYGFYGMHVIIDYKPYWVTDLEEFDYSSWEKNKKEEDYIKIPFRDNLQLKAICEKKVGDSFSDIFSNSKSTKELTVAEKLKNYPKGTQLYSIAHGDVFLEGVNDQGLITCTGKIEEYINYIFDENGKLSKYGEVVLFPSKEKRSWEDFEEYCIFKSFNKVLVRNGKDEKWKPTLFVKRIEENGVYYYVDITESKWRYCIPYDLYSYELEGKVSAKE